MNEDKVDCRGQGIHAGREGRGRNEDRLHARNLLKWGQHREGRLEKATTLETDSVSAGFKRTEHRKKLMWEKLW